MKINDLFNDAEYCEGMVYRTIDLCDFINSDEFYDAIDDHLVMNNKIYDENGMQIDEIDGQEVYLGYIVETDIFIIGFDIFIEPFKSQIIYFKIDDESNVTVLATYLYESLFYNSDYGYNLLKENCKKNFKNLIDLRLD